MKNVIWYKEGKPAWPRWIKARIKNNLNFLGIFQGPTGSGKTWSAISTAQQIDDTFKVDQIVFDFQELLDLINEDWFKKKKIKVIVFDEPQISLSNRAWQSTANKLMNYLLSTFRHQNIIVLFAAPYMDFLDSQSTRLFHAVFEMVSIERSRGLACVKPLLLQYNPDMKKFYRHALYVVKDGKSQALRLWHIPKPSEEMVELYEEKKTNFTNKLNKDIKEKLKKLQKSEEDERDEEFLKNRKPLTDKQRRVMETIAHHKYVDASKILNLPTSAISNYRKLAEKKGYRVEEFKYE